MDEASIRGLIKLWEERMQDSKDLDDSYYDALRDCIFELKQLCGIVDNKDEEEYKNPLPWMWF